MVDLGMICSIIFLSLACKRQIAKTKGWFLMKKILALMLVLLTVMMSGAAVAEAPFDGVWVQFEDGFEILLPAEWLELEATEEMIESGIFYAVCSPDGANTVQISWSALEAEMTAQELQAALATEYPDAEVLAFNGIEFIGFSDEENDIFGMAALDSVDLGMYIFWFTPNSDEAFADTAVAIATSIRNIE